MNWAEKILKEISSETTVIKFSGKENPTTGDQDAEFDTGWREGFAYAFFNYQVGNGFNPISQGLNKNCHFNRGWEEGVRYGIGKRLDILYPGAKQLDYNFKTKTYDAIY